MKTLKTNSSVTIFCILLMSFALSACAQRGSGGGFGAAGLMSVSEVLNLRRDDVPVTLQGRIIYHIRSDYYRFSDETGQIRIEIPPRVWGNLRVTADDFIEISGIVDRNFLIRNYVEVRSIRILTSGNQEGSQATQQQGRSGDWSHVVPRAPKHPGGPTNPPISAQRAVELAHAHILSLGITDYRFEYIYMDRERGQWVWSVEFESRSRGDLEFYVDVNTGAFLKSPR
ncbi:MAG: NirD/YgiW/YdeI family stress tolerance protein [Bacteroidales bacterium]|nr:NirD/YgiW/YdeI family stress tolerance protein [Bacteroidales bacterium]